MIELMRFRLRDGAEEEAFVEADSRLQTAFAYQQPGLLRRTTAKGETGWIVVDLWRSAADADACADRWDHDPVVGKFMSFVDADSVTSERYETL